MSRMRNRPKTKQEKERCQWNSKARPRIFDSLIDNTNTNNKCIETDSRRKMSWTICAHFYRSLTNSILTQFFHIRKYRNRNRLYAACKNFPFLSPLAFWEFCLLPRLFLSISKAISSDIEEEEEKKKYSTISAAAPVVIVW